MTKLGEIASSKINVSALAFAFEGGRRKAMGLRENGLVSDREMSERLMG